MTIDRRNVADEFDRLDDEIAELQTDKSEVLKAYREQLESEGMKKPEIAAEVSALKLAIRRRRDLIKDPNAVLEKDAKLDEILDEIRQPTKNNASTGSGGAGQRHSTETSPTRARANEVVEASSQSASPAPGDGAAGLGDIPANRMLTPDTALPPLLDRPDIPAFLRRGDPECIVRAA